MASLHSSRLHNPRSRIDHYSDLSASINAVNRLITSADLDQSQKCYLNQLLRAVDGLLQSLDTTNVSLEVYEKLCKMINIVASIANKRDIQVIDNKTRASQLGILNLSLTISPTSDLSGAEHGLQFDTRQLHHDRNLQFERNVFDGGQEQFTSFQSTQFHQPAVKNTSDSEFEDDDADTAPIKFSRAQYQSSTTSSVSGISKGIFAE